MPKYLSEIQITKPTDHFANVLKGFGIELDSNSCLSLSQRNAALGHLVNDTRVAKEGDVFCAVIGHDLDGNDFVDSAIEKGVSLVLSQCKEPVEHGNMSFYGEQRVPVVSFYQLGQKLFDLASAYYQCPQKSLSMIGITGTNGKTSTSQIVASLIESQGNTAGVIGTTGAGALNALTPIANTTPGSTELLTILSQFDALDIGSVAMEVSSHALTQRRVTGELFDIAVFTNLSRDHLDYHQTMDAYAAAKFSIFTSEPNQIAIVNGDDKYVQAWLATQQNTNQIIFGKSQKISTHRRYVKASNIEHCATGVTFTLETHLGNVDITSQLLGDFNVENLLAAISVLIAKGTDLTEVATAVANVSPVNGRMETFTAKNRATAVVDYAHTPDALENALLACKQHCEGELWVVFGCGGDRDTGKRPQMGRIAERIATHVIVTNDNPRNENPENIAQDILKGCQHPSKIKVLLNRQKAVIQALSAAQNKDVVLFAGKGHETSITIGDEVLSYDERALVQKTYQTERLS